MVRRRWPDVLVIVGIVAVCAIGIWALWGPDISDWWSPPSPDVEEPTHGGGVT